jgi:hypothetical protein
MTTVPLGLISYHEVESPITEPVTKFGGQPAWIMEPQWPLSRSTGKPMRFLCQVMIDPSLFGDVVGRMAYIFVNNPEDEMEDAGGNYEADAGENAVIVQPGHQYVATAVLGEGPTLRHRISGAVAPCEFSVTLEASEEPAYDPALSLNDEGDLSYESGFLLADKIGGSPRFVQGPEFPEGSGWRLLVQFGALQDALPFGGGFAYAFLAADGASGKMVWQR